MTIAKRIQLFYKEEQYGIKDIQELIDEEYIPQKIVNLGVDFLEFIESIYDEDGNYTDTGMSAEGVRILDKYIKKYGNNI